MLGIADFPSKNGALIKINMHRRRATGSVANVIPWSGQRRTADPRAMPVRVAHICRPAGSCSRQELRTASDKAVMSINTEPVCAGQLPAVSGQVA